MNKKVRASMLIGLLAFALILAACDRPSATNPLSDQSAQGVNATLTQDEAAQQTAEASGQDNSDQTNAPEGTPTETPIPGQPNPTEAAQPTSTPVPPQPTAAPVTGPTQPTAAPASGQCTSPYVVQPGDRLFSIGRACNVNPYAIAQANNIGAPFFIYPGQQLTIPGSTNATPAPATGSTTYIVRPGDNLFRISLMFGRSMQAIAAANGIINYNVIFVGQPLIIP